MQIQRSFKGEKKTGVLYLVPTPIGNREDMSYRMVQTLKDVDLIAAEDTRNTGLLLKHFEITTPQTSFHEHNAHGENSRSDRPFRIWKGCGAGLRCRTP